MKQPRIPKMIGMLLVSGGAALLVVIVYAIFLQLVAGASRVVPTSVTVQQTPHHSHTSEEAPVSFHRTQSSVVNEAATTLNPWGIAIDSKHGFVWVAEPGCEPVPTCPSVFSGIIGKYALSDGSFIEDFQEPQGYTSPLFVTVDADDHVWFTQPNSNAIGELDSGHGTWKQWQLKQGSMPYDLTFDTHGNLWFTEFGTSAIGFFDPQTHKLVETPTPTLKSNPYGITRDRRGNIWFTENSLGIGQIGSFTPTLSGKITIGEHAVATLQPHLITSDKAGNVWYSEAFAGSIGEFNPISGTSRNFPVSIGICPDPAACSGTHISGISIDGRGLVWFDDSLSGRVGYLNPTTGQVVVRTLDQSDAHPHDGLALDNMNTLWFTEQNASALVKWPQDTLT
ncbi:MAG: hypothetical protein JO183_09550 [Ktedonobacteraceae bacterium]|nr:hypothetical protein [Ktedonobacteraceae bacterium]